LNTPESQSHVLRFDAYAIDLQKCTPQRGDEVLPLRPKAFDLLCHLARNPGRVVGKQELLDAVWAKQIVTDDALVQCVRDVRQALSDHDQHIVKTVPRRGYLFCAAPARHGAAATVPMHPAQVIDYCRTRDGVRIAMAAVGQGLPLIRTPTWFNHLEYDWHVQFRGALYRFLADRVQLIRYDGRANGLSDRYVPGLLLKLLESDLQAVVDALELRSYALLGISQGAAIAIAHAVHYPERVTKLVLNGAFARGSNKRGSLRDQETAQAYVTLMRHGWGDEHSSFLRSFSTLFFPGASAEEIRALAQLQRMAMSAEAAVKLRNVSADFDILDLLPKVTAPTLVLHSTHDNAVPFEEGRRLAALIPNARFVALESQNHVPMPDEPAWPQFIAEIDAFLSQPA
jgi:pimeloyl-ACP methyl ester carboxylesterase/DNA-binding winged helix-turn-helix (wHTH) protein